MPGQEFNDLEFEPNQMFLASGLIESEYENAWLYVGVVQTTKPDQAGERKITGAAYGIGPGRMWATDDGNGDPIKSDDGKDLSNWRMQVHPDEDNPNLVEYDPAVNPDLEMVGFVLVQKTGGGLAGWIDSKFKLTRKAAAANNGGGAAAPVGAGAPPRQ